MGLPADVAEPGVEVLTQRDIAELPDAAILHMSCEELVCVIRAARSPVLRNEVNTCLRDYELATLRRMVFLCRRCCRHQIGYPEDGRL